VISIPTPVFVNATGIKVSHGRNKTRKYSIEKRSENGLELAVFFPELIALMNTTMVLTLRSFTSVTWPQRFDRTI